jgi:hypothetical protein
MFRRFWPILVLVFCVGRLVIVARVNLRSSSMLLLVSWSVP